MEVPRILGNSPLLSTIPESSNSVLGKGCPTIRLQTIGIRVQGLGSATRAWGLE